MIRQSVYWDGAGMGSLEKMYLHSLWLEYIMQTYQTDDHEFFSFGAKFLLDTE